MREIFKFDSFCAQKYTSIVDSTAKHGGADMILDMIMN